MPVLLRSITMAAATLAVPLLSFVATPASATTCLGSCGVSGANGVVGLAPGGHAAYDFVSTYQGVDGAGQLGGLGGTNGSRFTSNPIAAAAGQTLGFSFNYVTSDGAAYTDYAWARLVDVATGQAAYLFTARTNPDATVSPSLMLPPVAATLQPATSGVVPGGPNWSPLGSSSGSCWGTGCGYTGWIQSSYVVPTSGVYELQVGVTNWGDGIYDSGLAFDGASLDIAPLANVLGLSAVAPTPAPGEGLLGALALAAVAFATWRGAARRA
jgi:hypothetical protein